MTTSANLQFETFLASLKEMLESELDQIGSVGIARLVKRYDAYVSLLETSKGKLDSTQLQALLGDSDK